MHTGPSGRLRVTLENTLTSLPLQSAVTTCWQSPGKMRGQQQGAWHLTSGVGVLPPFKDRNE